MEKLSVLQNNYFSRSIPFKPIFYYIVPLISMLSFLCINYRNEKYKHSNYTIFYTKKCVESEVKINKNQNDISLYKYICKRRRGREN